MHQKNFVAVASFAFLVGACATTSSAGKDTSSFKPYFHVTVDTQDNSTLIDAIMGQEDDLTNIQLANGDSITATTDKDPTLNLSYDGTLQEYNTTLNATDRKTVTYVLKRTSGASAPSSVAPLPDAVALTAPTAMAKVSAASGNISLKWGNTVMGATMHFFAYPCGSAAAATSNDQTGMDMGSFTFPVSAIVSAAPTAAGQCIEIRIQRDVNGTLDPAFAKDATIFATRYDYVQILLTN
jgi:hypothetical protein